MTSASDYLDTHAITRRFLSLPRAYADALGGLRWSDQMDSVTFPGGETIATYEELAQFLEGFASQRPLLAFGALLHWAVLFNTETSDKSFLRLRNAFQAHGQHWRNAGALAGMMSDGLAAAADPPPVVFLCARLRERGFPIRWFTGLLNGISNDGEEPPLALVEFEQHVRHGIGVLSDDDLASWLKFGRGPIRRAGEDLARQQPPPRVLGNVLEELLARPRLAGAAAYVPQMVMALAVPPRRQAPEQLPMGGYADVVTHGSVDRLLPSQHALDDLEFQRRFSENELLFFRREEPPAWNRQEVVVVLDQGVRTWGDVRLVLTAAALALTKHADRKKMSCSLTCTSHAGFFANPLADADPRLGPALDASDLSPNPALALERALECPSAVPRDIFLLTHPFSVKEQDVQIAARRLAPNDRLFALTVNGRGNAELVELRRGLPVRLRSFRVEFVAAKTPAAKPAVAAPSWSGDVEPIGWPFRFGNDSPVHLFDFDCTGRCLFAVMKNSMLFAWDLVDGAMEILPRPQSPRGRLADWHDLVGVVDGFALLGSQESRYLVAHYDWKRRSCKVHSTTLPMSTQCVLTFVRHCNAVALLPRNNVSDSIAIDLSTGDIALADSFDQRRHGPEGYVVNTGSELSEISHHRRFYRAKHYLFAVGPETNVVAAVQNLARLDDQLPGAAYYYDPKDASLTIATRSGKWRPFVPHTDGKRTFSDARIQRILHGATAQNVQTVAIHYQNSPFQVNNHYLTFFRGPEGNFLRELRWVTSKANTPWEFRLSRDGDKVALLRNDHQIEVLYTERPERILLTRPGGFGTQSRLWVGHGGLLLCCGRKGYAWHLLQWSTGVLEVHSQMKPSKELRYEEFRHPRLREFICHGDIEEANHDGAAILGNAQRWPKGLDWHGVHFVLDRYGQVLIFDVQMNLVFQFFAHGDSWSAWMPDGTRHGRGMVHHWRNTPDALAAMGRALQNVALPAAPRERGTRGMAP